MEQKIDGLSWEMGFQDISDIDIANIWIEEKQEEDFFNVKTKDLFFSPNDSNELDLTQYLNNMNGPSYIESSPSSTSSSIERLLDESGMNQPSDALQKLEQKFSTFQYCHENRQNSEQMNFPLDQHQDIEMFSKLSQTATCNKVVATKKLDKRSIRREKNNKASRELRKRKKDEEKRLLEKEKFKKEQNEKLSRKLRELELKKESLINLCQYMASCDLKKEKEKFTTDFKNLICCQNDATNQNDVISKNLYDRLIEIYYQCMNANCTESEKNEIGEWLKNYFGLK